MNTPSANSKNVLNSDVQLKGTLKFAGELTFDGKVDGDISSDGSLHLVENAVVKGNINVSSVTVRGKVNGNITAKEKIDIKTKSELFFFFSSRRRHTRCLSDWSSDVCSSD